MAKYEDVATLVKDGHSPGAIAKAWNVPLSSITQYLYTAVGRRLLYRSEILFAIGDGQSVVKSVEELAELHGLRTRWDFQQLVRQKVPTVDQGMLDELLLCFDLRSAPLADMYELLCRLERYLHAYIRTTLEATFGPKLWWSKLPKKVRDDCQDLKEHINDPVSQDDPYRCTTFTHLKMMFDDRWGELCPGLPKQTASNKKKFLSELTTLNDIRNRVMHPVGGYRPSRADFDFVRTFVDKIFVEADEGL